MKFRTLILGLLTITSLGACSAEASAATVKPVIAINTDIDGDEPERVKCSTSYVNAIRQAGGIAVLLPPMPEDDLSQVLNNVDGVMMIGGDDYPPSLYKQEPHSSVSVMKETRSNFDMILVKAVLARKNMPFLGICAGCQALNIASGGSLHQDIPSLKPDSTVKHASPSGWKGGFNRHDVKLDGSSKLAKSCGKTELNVVSSHHQCVDRVGNGLHVVAQSPDGINEAIESTEGRFLIGVQWHPERDFSGSSKLFEAFVGECRKNHSDLSK